MAEATPQVQPGTYLIFFFSYVIVARRQLSGDNEQRHLTTAFPCTIDQSD